MASRRRIRQASGSTTPAGSAVVSSGPSSLGLASQRPVWATGASAANAAGVRLRSGRELPTSQDLLVLAGPTRVVVQVGVLVVAHEVAPGRPDGQEVVEVLLGKGVDVVRHGASPLLARPITCGPECYAGCIRR